MKTIVLNKGETLKLTEECWVSIKDGSLWLTYEDDLKDYVLEEGQRFHVLGRSPIVQALSETSINIVAAYTVAS